MAKFAHSSNGNLNPCHPGTFSAIFQQIFDWVGNSKDQRLMWLGGWPGTGKTTLAYSISVDPWFEDYFGASFMFQKSKDGCNSLDRFVGTVANQLAEKSIDYNNELETMLSARPSLQESRFEDQWKYLILHPLSKLPAEKSFLLIIDALDQCDRGEKLLSHLLQYRSNRLRVLVTSRPDIELSKFPNDSYIQIILHTIPAHIISQDIRVCLFANLRDRRPVDTDLDSLVDLSHGNFLWAVTASLYLNSDGLYNTRMERLLRTGTLEGEEKILDALYLTIIRDYTSLEKWGQDHSACCDLLQFFLGGIAVLFAPLTPRSFYRLVQSNNNSYDIHEILTSMKSLLEFPVDEENDDTYIRFHHPTFREFLLDHERCVKNPDDLICVNEKVSHQTLLTGCLNVLFDEWEFEGPGNPLPNEVKYACLYWAFHLEKSEMFIASNHMIFDFLYDHSLHWMEALGLMKSSNAALGALRSLSMVLRSQGQLEMLAFVQDLIQLVQYNQEIMDKEPSQIHSSSLIFAPQQSIVRQHFRDNVFRFVKDIPITCESWPLFRRLEGHCGNIQHLVFADSGEILVSTSSDKTLVVWDSVSGQKLRVINTQGLVTSMAVSRDGQSQFLAALSDGIIQVWNIKTGRVAQTLNTESGYEALIWRKNEAVLLAFRSDNLIDLWDITMGRCVSSRRWSQHHSSLSFSEDGSSIATWCSGSMIQIWKMNRRSFSRAAILSQMGDLNCIALSPEGGRLASASKNIHVFDTDTGSKLATLEGHIMNVRSLVFSKRSSVLASGSNDRTVKLWDLNTGQCLWKLEGHRFPIISLAFSYHDEILATGSLESSIYLWSTSAFFDHSSKRHVSDDLKLVTAVVCTDNGDAVAIGFSNTEIRLHRPENQDSVSLNEHQNQISDLHFIEKGASLVSASHDGSIIIWDVFSGLLLKKFANYGTAIQNLVFTDDQRVLAVVLINFTICVWIDGSPARPTLIGHTDYIEMVVFAKRKKLIISSSRDRNIRIWDMMDGKPLMILDGHQNWVTGLDLTSDEECLVSVSLDKTIRIWNTSNGQCSMTISNDFQMQSVAISGDKSTLASFSGNQMTIWDTKKSEIRKILRVRSSAKKSLSFSGNYLITENGSLALDKAVSDEIPFGRLCSAIYVDQAWIFQNGEKFIWIPREYRDLKAVFVRGNVVIFVKKSAEILTLKLSIPL